MGWVTADAGVCGQESSAVTQGIQTGVVHAKCPAAATFHHGQRMG